jgi:hypothetical protein
VVKRVCGLKVQENEKAVWHRNCITIRVIVRLDGLAPLQSVQARG